MTDATPIFIPTAEVAQLLQMSLPSFNAKRDWLERDHDFPPPMPHSKRPLLWRRTAIFAWIERQGLAPTDQQHQAPVPKTRADRLMQKAASA
ncbi:helix-turn-helix transcriptional regulator [Oceanicola sp. S124]|uniref:helix-turn-helix transcriptional regulator n=1 Tax=Oceanicola sp. S124 TaxID=1042378 RepID=UPI0002559C82|nr:hypothetical protein [Oceanicola sp. S124]